MPVEVTDSSLLSTGQGHLSGGETSKQKYFSEPNVVYSRLPKMPTGFVDDRKLIEWYYQEFFKADIRPIATDRFIQKSKETYNAAWLTRELVQNFVDHNPDHPGTLDGVHIRQSQQADGSQMFEIWGPWPFTDSTGITSLHSDKPTDQNSAGGNGIGLKQAAIRLLRDFGVNNFTIYGEGWLVQYGLIQASAINQDLQTKLGSGATKRVRHDWLAASMRDNPAYESQGQAGWNGYVIETDNLELIGALQSIKELGVSKENPYLQNPDFVSEKGALKWLHPDATRPEIPQEGRLFINGQVMNFKEKGNSSADYWRGPEYVTVQLNNVDYQISVDRPPLSKYDLDRYARELVDTMTADQVLEQLKHSEDLWSQGFDNDLGCMVIIEKLVRHLEYEGLWKRGYNPRDFDRYFGEKNYLAKDRITSAQANDLEKQGFILCPGYFEKIGMPKASSKLDTLEVAINERPNTYDAQRKLEQLAETAGVQVAYEQLDAKTLSQLIEIMARRFISELGMMQELPTRPATFRVLLSIDISKELLSYNLPNPKDAPQQLLSLIRGVAYAGLKNDLFVDKRIFLSQGEYVATFETIHNQFEQADVLFTRTVKSSNDQGVFLEFQLSEKNAAHLRSLLAARRPVDQAIDSPPPSTVPAEISGTEQVSVSENEPQKQTTSDSADHNPIGTLGSNDTEEAAVQETPVLPPQDDLLQEAADTNQSRVSLKDIDVSQPEFTGVLRQGRVITKELHYTKEQQEKLAQLSEAIPEMEEAVKRLDSLVPTEPVGGNVTTTTNPIEQYRNWRESDDFYGQASDNAGYLTGRHLLEIVDQYNQADIALTEVDWGEQSEIERRLSRLNQALKELANRLAEPEDQVDDFEIVLAPTQSELAQLSLIRTYIQIATGVALPNDLFLYDGSGSRGINIAQKAIGLHKELLKVDLLEALSTMTHEVAHNITMNHGPEFMHAMQSLFSKRLQKKQTIIGKLHLGEALAADEEMLVDVTERWNDLQRVNKING
jgi:hypothetical protein